MLDYIMYGVILCVVLVGMIMRQTISMVTPDIKLYNYPSRIPLEYHKDPRSRFHTLPLDIIEYCLRPYLTNIHDINIKASHIGKAWKIKLCHNRYILYAAHAQLGVFDSHSQQDIISIPMATHCVIDMTMVDMEVYIMNYEHIMVYRGDKWVKVCDIVALNGSALNHCDTGLYIAYAYNGRLDRYDLTTNTFSVIHRGLVTSICYVGNNSISFVVNNIAQRYQHGLGYTTDDKIEGMRVNPFNGRRWYGANLYVLQDLTTTTIYHHSKPGSWQIRDSILCEMNIVIGDNDLVYVLTQGKLQVYYCNERN